MKKLILAAIIFPSLLADAQRLHVNLYGGISNYDGDLQNKQFTFQESYAAFGVGLQYDLTHNFSLLTNFNFLHVGASDAYNKPDLQPRNLSFQTQIFEWNVLAEYNLVDLTRHRFSPYAMAGLAVYHFNPYAFDTSGNKVYLRPLSTEGEGLSAYPGQKPYALTQLAIPFGIGVKLKVTQNVVIGYEISYRKLFTGYLDDVHTTYVDYNTLLTAKGSEAVEMAYRGNELKGGAPYPPNGTRRGDPNSKDWYYFTGIRISIGLNTKGDNTYNDRGSVACPKNL